MSRVSPYYWRLLTAFVWSVALVVWIDRFVALATEGYRGWLVDWHVYASGAQAFVAGDLYRVPLQSAYPIPVNEFNLPPAAALTAVPLLVLPDEVAGTLWVVLNVVAVAVAAVLTARMINARPAWFWAGLAFLVYTVIGGGNQALLGNNTPLVLLLVVGFLTAHLAERSTLAGALLGVAIATKVWPATFLVVLARERSWRTFAWAVGVAGLVFGLAVLWLGGIGVIGPMVAALSIRDEITTQFVVGVTWLREHVSWWPEWGGWAISLLILLIPARGMTGYGLATLAGMVAIPNLWRHYWGTVAFGVVLLVRGLRDRRQVRARQRRHSSRVSVPAQFGEAERDPEFGS
jgi:Glycosyltransferase family 87